MKLIILFLIMLLNFNVFAYDDIYYENVDYELKVNEEYDDFEDREPLEEDSEDDIDLEERCERTSATTEELEDCLGGF